MAKGPYLHDHAQFKELIQIVSDKIDIVPQLVEKDYWIMHCLWGMQQSDFEYELKGGTSLSKGFCVIDRFSEDLDIRIEPPTGMNVKQGKNHTKPAHIESRRRYFDWIKNEINIPGVDSIERDTIYDDSALRNGGIRLFYKSHFPALQGVKDGVLLEIGFDDTTPNKAMIISSWARDHALSENVPFQDTRAINVKCYCIEYTFVEKLQTISTKFRNQQENGSIPKNFMRHYYDIYQLLEQPAVQKYIGTAEYEKRKKMRFRTGDNLKISENEAFILSDAATKNLYEREYKKTASLYYKGQVPFHKILDRIRENIDRL